MAGVAYTKLVHLDGRTMTRPVAGYQKNQATYEAAGWRQAGSADAPESAGVRIVSLHNAEKIVTASEFADIYEPAGWKRADETAKAGSETATSEETDETEETGAATAPKTGKVSAR